MPVPFFALPPSFLSPLRPAVNLEPALSGQGGELQGVQQRLGQQRGMQLHEGAVPAADVPLAVFLADLVNQGGIETRQQNKVGGGREGRGKCNAVNIYSIAF